MGQLWWLLVTSAVPWSKERTDKGELVNKKSRQLGGICQIVWFEVGLEGENLFESFESKDGNYSWIASSTDMDEEAAVVGNREIF